MPNYVNLYKNRGKFYEINTAKTWNFKSDELKIKTYSNIIQYIEENQGIPNKHIKPLENDKNSLFEAINKTGLLKYEVLNPKR